MVRVARMEDCSGERKAGSMDDGMAEADGRGGGCCC